MDLSKMTPKDKGRYEVAMERKEVLFASLFTSAFSEIEVEEVKEVIHNISRAEYKRGKADGSAESVHDKSRKEECYNEIYTGGNPRICGETIDGELTLCEECSKNVQVVENG